MSARHQRSPERSDSRHRSEHKSEHNGHSRERERHRRHDLKNGSNDSSKRDDRYEKSDRHHRRHDNRDSGHRSRGRDRESAQSSSYHSSGRRDDRRRERSRNSGNRSRSRSRSKSRNKDGNRDNRSSRQTSGSIPQQTTIEATNESKAEKGIQHKTSLDIMKEQLQLKTGIVIPDFYNAGVVNPIKYAEQERKRKLLWSREDTKKTPQVEKSSTISTSGAVAASGQSSGVKSNQWNGLKFEGEKGNEMTEKFRKLMGIKEKDMSSSALSKNESAIESQETLFRNLDLQYTIARLSTHTQRGVGLGFGGPQK